MLAATLDVFVAIRPLLGVDPIPVELSGHLGLTGPAPGPLARHDRPLQEKLSAPDTPGLAALQRA